MEERNAKSNFLKEEIIKIGIPLTIVFIIFLKVSKNLNYFFGLDSWFHISVIKKIIITQNFSMLIPLDPSYPTLFPPLFHIFNSIYSIIIGQIPEKVMHFIPLLFWLLIVLFVFIIIRGFFDSKTAFIGAILTSLIPTTTFGGGMFLPRPQIMGELFILVLLWVLFYSQDDLSYKNVILLILLAISIPLIHSFSGLILFPLIFLAFIFATSEKYKIKKIILFFLGILIVFFSFYFRILFKWGFPKKGGSLNILVSSINPFINLKDMGDFFGILFMSFGILSIILIIFIKSKKEEKGYKSFLIIWITLLISILILNKFGISILPKRIFYELIYPLIFIMSFVISYLIKKYNKYLIIFVLVLLIIIQFFNVISFNPEKDNLSTLQYNSFQEVSHLINQEDFVGTDIWSCYYVSAISQKKCYYMTGLYSNSEIKKEKFLMFFNGEYNDYEEYKIQKILIYKPLTFTWISSENKKINNKYLPEEEIYYNLEKLESSKKIERLYEDENLILFEVK